MLVFVPRQYARARRLTAQVIPEVLAVLRMLQAVQVHQGGQLIIEPQAADLAGCGAVGLQLLGIVYRPASVDLQEAVRG